MDIKQRALLLAIKLLKTGIQIIGRVESALISIEISESLQPTITQKTNFGEIQFFCPNKLAKWRGDTLLTKEPDTIEWINTFDSSDVLWDIGANAGAYSLYAALRDLRVVAFEPSAGNYYLLNKNIEINKMDGRICALCVAFTNNTILDLFYMANTEIGCAMNNFGKAVDWRGDSLINPFRQAIIGYSMDSFIEQFNPPFPNHIKIDVDGIEDKIIDGAQKTLKDKRVKSILIELNTSKDTHNKVIAILSVYGFELIKCFWY